MLQILLIYYSFMLANDRYKCYKFYLSIIHLCWLMIDINVTMLQNLIVLNRGYI